MFHADAARRKPAPCLAIRYYKLPPVKSLATNFTTVEQLQNAALGNARRLGKLL